jgi:hypothetical protein
MTDLNLPGESFDAMLARLTRERIERDPRTHQVRVNVEDRILESVEGGSTLTLRQVTDATNADIDSFVLGQGAIRAALDRMAAKGLVTIILGNRIAGTPSLFKFSL